MQRAQSLKNTSSVLYNAFIQDTIEFLMILMVPTERKLSLTSYKDLLPKKEDKVTPMFEIPDWLQPLIKVCYFLHFFRDEMRLPADIMQEVFSSTQESHL